MSDLWESHPLQSLVTKVGSGSTPRGGSEAYKAVGTPLIRSMNVVFFGFKRKGLVYIDDEQAAQLDNATVKAGDVLLNITGASIGRVTLAPVEFEGARVNQHVCVIRPNEALDARFLNAYLSSPALQDQIWNDNFGVTRQALTKQQILDFEIPLPPKAEQVRIVNELDTLLARVQACNDRFDSVPALLKRFRQTALEAAMAGGLTEDWRKNLDFQTNEVALRDLGAVTGGLTKNSKRDSLPLRKPYLRVANVHANYLTLGDVTEIGLTPAEFEKTRLQADDLLIVEGNGSLDQIGRVAMWRSELTECSHQNHLIRWRAGSTVLARYVLFWLLSPTGRRQIVAAASSSTGLHTLSVSKVGSLTLQIPTIEEQAEIVQRVDALFAMADRIEARCNAARTQAQRLTPLLLAKAFRGELVPQDPNDEPACKLLARIELGAATKPKRTAKTSHVQAAQKRLMM